MTAEQILAFAARNRHLGLRSLAIRTGWTMAELEILLGA